MGTPGAWKPVLEGRLRTTAEETIEAIVSDLEAVTPGAPGTTGPQGLTDPFQSLFFAEISRRPGAASFARYAFEGLDRAIAGLEHAPVRPALFGGFCGVGWLAVRLQRMLWTEESDPTAAPVREAGAREDPCEEVDEALLERLPVWTGDYDLISGLVGIGIYALERLSCGGEKLLRPVVRQLKRRAQQLPDGLAWFTPPERLPRKQRLLAPAGYYNLGVAHGVPGVIGFLGHVCRSGVAVDEAGPLLEGAVAWVLRRQLPEGDGARYASWDAPGAMTAAGRSSWCYGGLGLSAALMVAGRSVANSSWQNVAIEFASLESRRPADHPPSQDACLCHGAAGNAFIFQRFYEATGDERFLTAARNWYARALELRRPGTGIGGYRFWSSSVPGDSTSPLSLLDNASFLVGSAGVGLALLAATGTTEPSWDRLLVTDIPC